MFNELIFRPILNLLLVLYSLVGDFGLAVILFTIIVKILIFPLLKSQTIQMKKMQDIQPELKKIRAKTKNNKQLEYIMTMSLYKQNGIKMSASFFTTLIQLPILIAMFTVVRTMISNPEAITNLAYNFVKTLAPIQALITDHTSFKPMLLNIVDLSVIPFQFNAGMHTFFTTLFVVGAAWTQYYLINAASAIKNPDKRRIRDILAEASEGKEPDQSEINNLMMVKMNKIMPIIILVSFGAIYGAIGFYQFVSGLISIIQRKIILSKIIQTEVKPVDNSDVEERLKRAKTAEIILQNRQKQLSALKKSRKK
ncbi:MAG: YidC/Oxa1 family membrane protein insertase [Candidatus Saccharibacteria bacterium]|nr:YidC/Oxa1 family membrane protein insertase [Candidatus Saccharibacteria bacterium]